MSPDLFLPTVGSAEADAFLFTMLAADEAAVVLFKSEFEFTKKDDDLRT